MRSASLAVLAILLSVSTLACKEGKHDTRPPEQIWSQVCSTCHGLQGEGLPHKLGRQIDMRSPEWQAQISDAQIADTVRNGKQSGLGKRMPAWGKRFSDEQIEGLVRYIRTEIAPAQTPTAPAR